MHVLIFGATGRVGAAAVDFALAAGYEVTAFVRNPAAFSRTDARLRVVKGDVNEPSTVESAVASGIDAVLFAVGGNVFKPSTLVTDSVRAIVAAMQSADVKRYVGITGVAQMPATPPGKIVQKILALSPIRYAVRDHQGAYEIVAASDLDFTLAGCPYIKDGETRGTFKEVPGRFHAGYHIIHPGDVGKFLVDQLADTRYPRQIVGIWY
jgi:putative NADH-flavin reductase